MGGDGILFYGFCIVLGNGWGGIGEKQRGGGAASCSCFVLRDVLNHRCTGFGERCHTGCGENRQYPAMAVRFTVRDGQTCGDGWELDHHEESKKAGNSVRTAIIKPERQAGQQGSAVGRGEAGWDRDAVTWRS